MKGILAGCLIALGAFAYLSVGGVVGSILFSFGIICIVKLGIPLYTGVAGTDIKISSKVITLVYNIMGTFLLSILFIAISKEDIVNTAQNIFINKMHAPWYVSLIKAIACGIIVDISVFLSKKDNNVIPLLIGIPLFILCGFNHSIADVAYIIIGATEDASLFKILFYYTIVVLGNYIGCNFRRFAFFGDENK